ncbi:hypothetical protein TNCV_4451781 [Trichonephila clavipes]|nr:hypothetical protein TNCV_4451781 [Trichonephila clavipes]
MTTDYVVGVRWDPATQQEMDEFEYDGGNSSSRLFERSRIRVLAERDPRRNIALNNEKNAVFTAERYSVFAEEAIQFTVNGRNILMERKRKKRGKRESPKLHDERCQSLPPE